jgi:hypothetical protein
MDTAVMRAIADIANLSEPVDSEAYYDILAGLWQNGNFEGYKDAAVESEWYADDLDEWVS